MPLAAAFTAARPFSDPVRRATTARHLLVVAVALLAALACGGKGKEGQRGEELPYSVLDKAFQPLRRDFEEAGGKVRLVGIVTPTCGDCLDMLATIDGELLPLIPSKDFEVFAVWVANIGPDVEVGARQRAEKWADPRIHHYWDGSGRISRAFGRYSGLPEGTNVYGLFHLYGRNDTWDPQGTMESEPKDFNAILNGWQPSPPRVRAGKHPKLTLPQFRGQTLRPKIEELLAEPYTGVPAQ